MKMHRIRKNHSTASPVDLFFWDCETKPEGSENPLDHGQHKLWFGFAIYCRLVNGEASRRQVFRFNSKAEFWAIIRSLKRSKSVLWCFAHNLGFDATISGLWEMVDKNELRFWHQLETGFDDAGNRKKGRSPFPLLVLDDPPTIIKATLDDSQKLIFLDTLNYWRISLKTLGASVGLEKLEMPHYQDSQEKWDAYCLRDVEVIEKCVISLINWVKENDYGKFRYTAPSQAMAAYRHRFGAEKILTHDDDKVRAMERAAYYGGQVEVYRAGEIHEKIYQLDVTSLYPSVMQSEFFPYRFDKAEIDCNISPKNWSKNNYDKLAHVTIDTLERSYPIRKNGNTTYVTGYFKTWLSGPELHSAIQSGHVRRIHSYVQFGLRQIFRDFVNHFWQQRLAYKNAQNLVGDTLCKMMMNSLYGKFGQTGPDWKEVPNAAADIRWGSWSVYNTDTGECITRRSLGDHVQEAKSVSEIPTAFPAIAAWVTSYGREKMRNLREIAGIPNVYYQAVDALYVNSRGYLRLNDAEKIGRKEFGKLDLVGTADFAEFRCINNYTLGTKHVRGCIKPSAIRIDSHSWRETRFQHLAGIISGKTRDSVITSPVIKTLQEKYTRGIIQPSGLVTPLRILDSD